MTETTDHARVVSRYLLDNDLPFEEPTAGTFVVVVPGAHKLSTTVSLVIGDHALSINAFVARHPDENAEHVYRWLLERNRRMYAVSFCVDHLGDIYLAGRLPLDASLVEVKRVRAHGGLLPLHSLLAPASR